MKFTFARLLGLGALSASAALAGTHVGIGLSFGLPRPVVVRHAPPPRVIERVTVTPGAGYVWLPGHYSWAGDHWQWLPGAWVVPPRSDARWVDGVWHPQTQQWVEGHWEVPAPAPTAVVVPPPAPPPTVVTPSPAPVVVPSPAPAVVASNDIVLPDAPPPPPEVEVRTVAPQPGYVWIAGYWGWENGRRQWYRGHWERPPHGYRVWVAPRWEHRAHGYVFVRGYWM